MVVNIVESAASMRSLTSKNRYSTVMLRINGSVPKSSTNKSGSSKRAAKPSASSPPLMWRLRISSNMRKAVTRVAA